MNLRQVSTLAALLAVTLATFPISAASPSCDDAILAFQEAFAAAAFSFNADVARQLASALEICGNGPPVDPGSLPPVNPGGLPDVVLGGINAAARPVLARDCGATSVPPLAMDAADITVTYQVLIPSLGPVGPTVKVERDQGPATGTFDPNTNLTTYTTRSTNASLQGVPKWGLDSWNSGNVVTGLPQSAPGYGIIYVYGVPIPAFYVNGWGTARAGCTDQTLGTVCWAEGTATVTLSTAVWLNVRGSFSRC